MEENIKEVYYDGYCQTCKHEKESEASDACNECLNTPGRQYSHKPIKWEEK